MYQIKPLKIQSRYDKKFSEKGLGDAPFNIIGYDHITKRGRRGGGRGVVCGAGCVVCGQTSRSYYIARSSPKNGNATEFYISYSCADKIIEEGEESPRYHDDWVHVNWKRISECKTCGEKVVFYYNGKLQKWTCLNYIDKYHADMWDFHRCKD